MIQGLAYEARHVLCLIQYFFEPVLCTVTAHREVVSGCEVSFRATSCVAKY